MQRLGVERQLLARSGGQDDRPAAGLGHAVLASLVEVEQISEAVITGVSAKSLHLKSEDVITASAGPWSSVKVYFLYFIGSITEQSLQCQKELQQTKKDILFWSGPKN